MAEYDQTSVLTAAGSHSTTATQFTCSSSVGHNNAGGGWTYAVSGTSIGCLNFIESSSTSSTTCSLVPHTATTAAVNGDTFIIIGGQGLRGIALGTTMLAQDKDADFSTLDGTYAPTLIVLNNYIEYNGVAKRQLADGDASKSGLNSLSVKFYSKVCIAPSHWFNDRSGTGAR